MTNETQIEPGRHRQEHSLLEQLMTISRAAALEEMASGIAHELNQPLGAIVTFAQTRERLDSQDSIRTARDSGFACLLAKQ